MLEWSGKFDPEKFDSKKASKKMQRGMAKGEDADWSSTKLQIHSLVHSDGKTCSPDTTSKTTGSCGSAPMTPRNWRDF
jgi:hypothetical protein